MSDPDLSQFIKDVFNNVDGYGKYTKEDSNGQKYLDVVRISHDEGWDQGGYGNYLKAAVKRLANDGSQYSSFAKRTLKNYYGESSFGRRRRKSKKSKRRRRRKSKKSKRRKRRKSKKSKRRSRRRRNRRSRS